MKVGTKKRRCQIKIRLNQLIRHIGKTFTRVQAEKRRDPVSHFNHLGNVHAMYRLGKGRGMCYFPSLDGSF